MKKIFAAILLLFVFTACAPLIEKPPERVIAPPVVPEVEPGSPEDFQEEIGETSAIEDDLAALDDLDAELASLEDLI